jgi:catechol 2,3-dioxygenase-like lactoylglutathione lyase family enzyme
MRRILTDFIWTWFNSFREIRGLFSGEELMKIYAIDHVQLAMPMGEEARARAFFCDVLGMTEAPKPAALAARGGAWFMAGAVQLHLGVEPEFRPARKAHPALLVDDLAALVATLAAAGVVVIDNEPALEGYRRVHIHDPFGNRIELMEKLADLR